jgi:hypothetical protein
MKDFGPNYVRENPSETFILTAGLQNPRVLVAFDTCFMFIFLYVISIKKRVKTYKLHHARMFQPLQSYLYFTLLYYTVHISTGYFRNDTAKLELIKLFWR